MNETKEMDPVQKHENPTMDTYKGMEPLKKLDLILSILRGTEEAAQVEHFPCWLILRLQCAQCEEHSPTCASPDPCPFFIEGAPCSAQAVMIDAARACYQFDHKKIGAEEAIEAMIKLRAWVVEILEVEK